jgi:hypothetical protein
VRSVAKVRLNAWEFKACVDVANARMAISNDKGLNHGSTYTRTYLERIDQEVTGACGEMAVCKALGRFWTPSVNTFHAIADVSPAIEVRATTRLDGSLIVRDNDPSDRYYFLVVGEPPELEVVGYMLGAQAKHPTFMRDPHGHRQAYFVPQHLLTRIQGDR